MDVEPLAKPDFGGYELLRKEFLENIADKSKLIIHQTLEDPDKLLSIPDYPEKELPLNVIRLPQKSSIYKDFKKPRLMEELRYDRGHVKSKSPNQFMPTIQNFRQTPPSKWHDPDSKPLPLPPWPLNSSNLRPSVGYIDFDKTKPEDLPEMALPILEFMEDVQPHIVIGCDRGGRLFGLAVHAAWQQTREGKPFPTLDGKLHFARVSKSEDSDILQEKIDRIVASSKQFGKQRGNEVTEGEQLRVLFIDDWVLGGGTMRLAQRMMDKHGAQTYFAVMCGDGADATGQANLHTNVSWHDRPEEIGVNYLSTIQENPDGTVSQQQEVIAVHSSEAIRNRRRIQRAAKALQRVRILEKVA